MNKAWKFKYSFVSTDGASAYIMREYPGKQPEYFAGYDFMGGAKFINELTDECTMEFYECTDILHDLLSAE